MGKSAVRPITTSTISAAPAHDDLLASAAQRHSDSRYEGARSPQDRSMTASDERDISQRDRDGDLVLAMTAQSESERYHGDAHWSTLTLDERLERMMGTTSKFASSMSSPTAPRSNSNSPAGPRPSVTPLPTRAGAEDVTPRASPLSSSPASPVSRSSSTGSLFEQFCALKGVGLDGKPLAAPVEVDPTTGSRRVGTLGDCSQEQGMLIGHFGGGGTVWRSS